MENGVKHLAKILLVDDESDIVFIMKRFLETREFIVDSFTSPVQALEHFKKNSKDYSIVVSDIRMPGLTGIELLEEIKKIAPEVKVVLMSAFDIPKGNFSDISESTLKPDDFIQKPAKMNDLYNKITSQLTNSENESDE